MEEPPADEDPPLDGDEEELGDEGEEEAADDENEDANADPSGGAAEGGKRRLRRRLRADELNLLKAPMDVIVELTEATLEELADNRKLHQLRYRRHLVFRASSCARPTGCVRSRAPRSRHARPPAPPVPRRAAPPRRQGPSAPLRRQELDLSGNKLMVLDGLEQFSTLKVLRAARNQITEVTIEKLPRLKILDLSHNKLDGLPDLCPPFRSNRAPPPPTTRRRTPPPLPLGRRRRTRASEARATPSIRRRQVRLQGAHLCRLFAQRESPLPHNPKPHAAGRAPPRAADSQPAHGHAFNLSACVRR